MIQRLKMVVSLCFALAMATETFAQQEAHYTHFMYNQQWLNPAYIGSRGTNSLTGLFRQQWIGFQGAPQSQMVAFNGPIGDGRGGIGIAAARFGIGLVENWHANLGYSYAIVKTDQLQIRAGIHGVFRRMKLDPNDPTIYIPNRTDPVLAGENYSRASFNAGAGVYAQAEKWFAGVGCPSIMQQPLVFNSINDTAGIFTRRHYFGTVGGMFALNDKFNLRPSLMVKYVQNAPVDFDINAMVIYAMKIGFGLSYRAGGDGPGESIDALVHYQLSSKMGLGISYDYTLSQLNNVSNGSFEAFARFEWGSKMGDELTNPRFFY